MLAFVSAFLGALFLIIIIAVQVVSSVYTDNYVKHNVYVQQSNFDQSINTLLINTNFNLIKLFMYSMPKILLEEFKTFWSSSSFKFSKLFLLI